MSVLVCCEYNSRNVAAGEQALMLVGGDDSVGDLLIICCQTTIRGVSASGGHLADVEYDPDDEDDEDLVAQGIHDSWWWRMRSRCNTAVISDYPTLCITQQIGRAHV